MIICRPERTDVSIFAGGDDCVCGLLGCAAQRTCTAIEVAPVRTRSHSFSGRWPHSSRGSIKRVCLLPYKRSMYGSEQSVRTVARFFVVRRLALPYSEVNNGMMTVQCAPQPPPILHNSYQNTHMHISHFNSHFQASLD